MHIPQKNAGQVTGEQKIIWDNSARSYSDVLIRKGPVQPNAHQMVAAVLAHLKDATGVGVIMWKGNLSFS